MSEFNIVDAEDDYATLVIHLGEDDSAEAILSGSRHESRIRLALYAYEAKELIELLTPLAQAGGHEN